MVKNDKLRWFLVVSTFFCSFLITTSARSQTVDYAITVSKYVADKTVCITNVDSLSRETLIKLKLVDE